MVFSYFFESFSHIFSQEFALAGPVCRVFIHLSSEIFSFSPFKKIFIFFTKVSFKGFVIIQDPVSSMASPISIKLDPFSSNKSKLFIIKALLFIFSSVKTSIPLSKSLLKLSKLLTQFCRTLSSTFILQTLTNFVVIAITDCGKDSSSSKL